MPNRTYVEQIILKEPFGWKFSDPFNTHAFPFEEVDFFEWHAIIKANWALAYYVGALYILAIFGVQRYMINRPAFDLRTSLFWWNLSLGAFSVFGFVRVVPGFINTLLKPNGFYTSICLKTDTDTRTGFWILMFILSKFIELGDTLFIVLRKRPLIFLQWYHHLVTMTVVWVLAPLVEPIARWYSMLNFLVHSLMYPYFAFKAKGMRIPTTVANLITTLQLTQMLIGFGVNMLSMFYQQTGYDCARYPISIKAFSLVYGSFILLFGKLFYDSVIKSGREKKEKLANEKKTY